MLDEQEAELVIPENIAPIIAPLQFTTQEDSDEEDEKPVQRQTKSQKIGSLQNIFTDSQKVD